MAGIAHPGLSRSDGTGFRAEQAGPADDAALRRLLRARPMQGQIRLTLEREPSFRAAQEIEGDRHYTIVIRDLGTGEIVGMGTRSVRDAWVNGRLSRLGYLGALRSAPGKRGLARLAAGYRAIEATRRVDELPFDLTSVVSDNTVARRLLERGLPELPRYHRICDYHTLLVPVGRRRRIRDPQVEIATADDLEGIARCLARNLRRYQFAPVWSESALRSRERCRDLSAADFLLIREGARIVACAACWDQRGFKQAVVRGYAPRLERLRPALNFALGIASRPRLPEVGASLPLAYVSHLAVDGDRPELALALIDGLRQSCTIREVELLAVGFAGDHPLLPRLARRYRALSYRSGLYTVQWPGAPAPVLDGRIPHVEMATL